MPEKKPGSTPDQPSTPSWTEPPKVWETGETPDQSRVPGTRRLWAAGVLAVAVLIGSVTAISLQERRTEDSARERESTGRTKVADESLVPTVAPAAPDGKSGLSSPQPSASKSSKSSESQQGGAKDETESDPKPSKSSESSKKPSSPSKPSTASWKSIESVNYPGRYWHVSSGLVKLDAPRGSESREDSTFNQVKGLSNSSCYSFKTSDGTYLRHRNFVLRAERNDGSDLFSKDATFCPGWSGHPGAVLLTSVNYPNYALRHRNFELRLDPYGYNTTNRQDFYFRLVEGLD
ncbi:AbfB domain-containing protein [Streptomyces phyllanthi]|uniref:Alpha-L-arabinofuranosidase n=1 Tax=Streptomyces phyllanthi TaxID=1803180 RepID=A0A5N8WAM4_9ACTN|nr:AbfB domain-containing protein [Streptomyces phyllanthi]MPY44182.1 alpha-L-arabinofuranosidase [Streptomyces phyllanthi]